MGVFLKAGVRPKKAIKVRTETAMVKITMARTAVMVKVGQNVLAWRGRYHRSDVALVCYSIICMYFSTAFAYRLFVISIVR